MAKKYDIEIEIKTNHRSIVEQGDIDLIAFIIEELNTKIRENLNVKIKLCLDCLPQSKL